MIVAISAENAAVDAAVDPRFGRCAYFAVCDTETESWRFIENEGVKAGGGAGLAAAQQMINNRTDTVITGNMGPNAFDVMHSDDVRIFQCTQGTVQNAVRLLSENKLKEITASGPSHAGMQGGSV